MPVTGKRAESKEEKNITAGESKTFESSNTECMRIPSSRGKDRRIIDNALN